jgi:hypothetical protein
LGRDSAIVFGVVKDADTDSLLAGAAVTADWLGFGPGDSSRMRILELTATAMTDGTGSYRICGVRLSSAAHVQVRAGAGVSGVIELSPGPRGILRQDFSVSRTAGAVMDSGNGRAAIEGRVVGPGRRAVAEAQVDVGHVRVARSKSDGSFVLSGLPAGTQELHVRAIGYAEARQVVNLRSGDTAHVSIELQARLDLDTLQVLAQTRATRQMADFEQRRKTGLAYTMTDDEVKRHPSIRTLFQAIPSATVTGRSEREFSVLLPAFGSLRRGNCVANVYVDGVRSDFEEVGSLSIDDVAAVEVYIRAAEVPPQFVNVSNSCGVILLWLKRMR